MVASPLCVLIALPFGDVSGGWNFMVAPLAAATATFVVAKRSSVGWSLWAAFLTEALLLIIIAIVVVGWGV
jgi:hypothetical protein